MRVFKFDPDGNSSPAYKVGFGTVDAGGVYVVDPKAEPERVEAVEHDPEFKELKGRQAESAIAAVASADPDEVVSEIADTHPPDEAQPDAPAGEETK